MKRLLLLAACVLFGFEAHAQAVKPTIMVVPSDAWCIENGYFNEIENMGSTRKVPDYVAALQSDMDLLQVISKLNDLMADRNFPLQNLESVIKDIETSNADMGAITSKSGASISTTLYDEVRNRAKADIIMQISWKVIRQGPNYQLSYILQGLDSYTNKQIAGSNGIGEPSHSVAVPVLLVEAVSQHIEPFADRLTAHFKDMQENGREVSYMIRVFDSWENDLETDYDGYELCEIIDDWFYENTKGHRYSIADQSSTTMNLTQVRIPLYDDRGRAQDAQRFIRPMVRYFRDTYGIEEIKVQTMGLGRCVVIFGAK